MSEFLREVLAIYGVGVTPDETQIATAPWPGLDTWEFDPKGYATANVTIFVLAEDEE